LQFDILIFQLFLVKHRIGIYTFELPGGHKAVVFIITFCFALVLIFLAEVTAA